jgi:hypothetical protein
MEEKLFYARHTKKCMLKFCSKHTKIFDFQVKKNQVLIPDCIHIFHPAHSILPLGSSYYESTKYEGGKHYAREKFYVCFDGLERGTMVSCLNNMRTKLISEGKYHDAVDDLLLKIIDAPMKKIKVICKEG